MTGLAVSRRSTRRARTKTAGRREGVRAGLVGATTVWLWLFLDDLLSGTPLRTAVGLGRALDSVDRLDPSTPAWVAVVTFTVVHYALWVGVGSLAMRAVRRAGRTPSVLLFTVVVLILLQFLLVGIAAMLAQRGLGALAWRDVAVGNVIGWGALCWYAVRRHPDLRGTLARAAEGRDA